MFSCKRWTSTKFVRSQQTVETLAPPKHGKILLKPISQTKEKHDSHILSRSNLWMVWRWHGIPRLLLFLFRTNGNNTWNKKTSVTVMVILFESGILKVTLSQLSSKSLLNNYEAHWQKHFERYPTVLYFMDMDQNTC